MFYGYSCFTARPHLYWYIGGARQTIRPRVASLKHGVGTPRRGGTVGILRIASRQGSPVCAREAPYCSDARAFRGGLGQAATTVVWSIGCFPGRVAEWQTRWLQ